MMLSGHAGTRRAFEIRHALVAGAAVLYGLALPYGGQLAIAVLLLTTGLAISLVVAEVRRPMAGVEFLVAVAVLTPLETGGWASTSLLITVVLVGIWFLRQTVVRGQLVFATSTPVMATLGLMAVAVLAFIAGQFPWFPLPSAPISAQLGGLAIFLASTGILLVVASVASRRDLQRLMWLFVATGAASVLAIATGLSEIKASGLTIATGTSLGSVFYTWLVALSAGQALWNTSLSRLWRRALLGVAVLVMVHQFAVLSSWASAWVPPLIALGTILLMRAPRLTIAATLVLLPLLLRFGSDAAVPVMETESYSLDTRIAAAESMTGLMAYSPWIGFGPANYHYYTPLFPILGHRVRFNSHNNYLDVLAQIGIVGLAFFVLIFVALSYTTYRLARHFPSGFEKAYLMGALGGILGTAGAGMLGDWVIPFVYNVGVRGFRSSVLFWLFAGGVLAIDRIRREHRRSAERSAPSVYIRQACAQTAARV